MSRIHLLTITGLIAMLAACVGTSDAKNQLKSMSIVDLCEDYYSARQPAVLRGDTSWPTKRADIKQEIDNRQVVSPADWTFLDSGHIQAGMSECALRAAWGFPLRVDHSTTAAGDAAHFVYSSVQEAYVVNGKVTTFRNQ
jgi:hypothetical protein